MKVKDLGTKKLFVNSRSLQIMFSRLSKYMPRIEKTLGLYLHKYMEQMESQVRIFMGCVVQDCQDTYF
jgi:hypothetical protein